MIKNTKRALYESIMKNISREIKKALNEAADYHFVSTTTDDIDINNNKCPKSKEELKLIIDKRIDIEGPNCDLNDIDVSLITDMSKLFYQINFNGDISLWDVSNVTNMRYMFALSNFNGDISNWDVSNVTNMFYMFAWTNFNGDISNWDVSNVKDMGSMFWDSKFNGDISKWDVSNVEYMRHIFFNSKFNGDISLWKLNPKCDCKYMYEACPLEFLSKKLCKKLKLKY